MDAFELFLDINVNHFSIGVLPDVDCGEKYTLKLGLNLIRWLVQNRLFHSLLHIGINCRFLANFNFFCEIVPIYDVAEKFDALYNAGIEIFMRDFAYHFDVALVQLFFLFLNEIQIRLLFYFLILFQFLHFFVWLFELIF